MTDWQEVAAGYDKVADDIWEEGYLYTDSLRLLDDVKGDVLDIGCGQGVFLEHVVKRFPEVRSINGCDISQELVGRSKKRHPAGRFEVANALTLEPFEDETFDFVFMICSLEHMVEHQKALSAARRVLRPGGKIAVTVPNRNWVRYEVWKRNHVVFQPIDDYWFMPAELIGLLHDAGFKTERVLGGWAMFRGNWIHLVENLAADVIPLLRYKMKNIGVRAVKL